MQGFEQGFEQGFMQWFMQGFEQWFMQGFIQGSVLISGQIIRTNNPEFIDIEKWVGYCVIGLYVFFENHFVNCKKRMFFLSLSGFDPPPLTLWGCQYAPITLQWLVWYVPLHLSVFPSHISVTAFTVSIFRYAYAPTIAYAVIVFTMSAIFIFVTDYI